VKAGGVATMIKESRKSSTVLPDGCGTRPNATPTQKPATGTT